MTYAIDILQRALKDEESARSDALECLQDGNIKKNDWYAFTTSAELAEERIPQLKEAIEKLKS